MVRESRIQYYGAIYHIIQKGKNGEKIFLDDEDKSYLLKLISEAKQIKDFKIFAYVIMDSSYHFLIKTLNIPISNIMHCINLKYAKYYNIKFKRAGAVFHERYRATLLQDERYILPIMKYIHRYPVKVGLCRCIEEYKWSSHVFYRVNMESMVDIEQVLNMFSYNRLEAIKMYSEFMEREDEYYEDIENRCENGSIIGSDDFIRWIRDKKGKRRSLDDLLKESCQTQEEFCLIKNGSRKRYLTQYKVKYISLGKREGYTFKEIGENIGLTGSAVRSLAEKSKQRAL